MEPIFFPSAQAFCDWLTENHASSVELLVGFWKVGTGKPTLTWSEAVDQALCFGWIDGVRRSIDAESYCIRFTPRRTRSIWSKVNVEKATALIAAGKMQPAGLAQVEAAKADGRWEAAYDPQSAKSEIEFLNEALAANPKARAFYDTLSSQNKYAIRYRLQTAKKPETLKKRLAAIVEMLKRGETFH